ASVYLAELFQMTGRDREAREHYRTSIERIPDHEGLRTSYARFVAIRADSVARDVAEAVGVAEQATRRSPTDGDLWNTLGAAYYRAGRWDDAIAALERSARLRSDGGE